MEDLDELRRHPPRGRVIVELALPDLETRERAALERRISRSLLACGCNEGAVAGLLYLVSVPLLLVAGVVGPDSWLDWVLLVAGFVAAMLIGKIIGLAIARVVLWRAIADTERALLAQQALG